MKKNLKHIITLCLFCVLTFHFVLIIIYSSPVTTHSSKLFSLSKTYAYPFFHQSWSLFVPAPKYKNYLFVKTTTSEKWELVFPSKLSSFNQSVFLGNDIMSLLFSNAIIYELNYLPNKSIYFATNPLNIEFKVLSFEVIQYLKQHNINKSCKSFDMMIISQKENTQINYLFKNVTIN